MENKIFTSKKIALAAMFVAVSYALSFLEFPIFPAASFYKLDFSFSFQLIGAFMLGPVLGSVIVVMVQALRLLSTASGGVGELANLITAACFVILPSAVYTFKKGLPTVIVSLIAATVVEIGVSLLANRFLMFPLYGAFLDMTAEEMFKAFFPYVIAFNAIKCVSNAVITLLLYKRLKKLFNKML